jgi:hypothetical protein
MTCAGEYLQKKIVAVPETGQNADKDMLQVINMKADSGGSLDGLSRGFHSARRWP